MNMDPHPLSKGGWHRHALATALACIPILVYLTTTWALSRNLPIFDDYIVQIEIARLRATADWSEKLSILFSQLNEHRLAYTRLWFWLSVELTGSISYKSLIAIGNASVVGVGLLFYSMGRRLSVPLLTWVPLSWLLFQFQYYPNSLWAMASLQNLTIHFLYLLLFMLITRPGRRRLAAAGLTAVVTCYTSGNGLIAPVLCSVVLLYQGRYRALGGWLLMLVVLLIAYFGTYQPAENLPVHQSVLIRKLLLGTLVFLGLVGKFPATSPLWLASYGLLAGLFALGLSVWSVRHLLAYDKARQLSQPAYALMAVCLLVYGFIFVSAVAVVRGRWALGGLEAILTPRYSLYSTLWLMTLYVHVVTVGCVQQWRMKRAVWMAIGASTVFWGSTLLANLSSLHEFRSRALSDYYNWTHLQPIAQQRLVSRVFVPSGQEKSELALINYTLKHDTVRQAIAPDKGRRSRLVVRKTGWQSHRQTLYVVNYPPPGSLTDWRYVVLEAPGHKLMFPARFDNNLHRRGLKADVLSFFMRRQPYRVGVLRKDGVVVQLQFSNQYVTPDGRKPS